MKISELMETINQDIIRVDNPGGQWLQDKIEDAEHYYKRGMKMSGPVTAYTLYPINLPVSLLKTIKGLRDEDRRPGEPQYDRLYPKIKKYGFDKDNAILIGINYKGEVYIIEGNTRVAVANDINIKYIPCEVKYFAGGEQQNSILHPSKIKSLVKED